MTPQALLERFTTGPAAILGVAVPERQIELDCAPERPVPVATAEWRSKARNCPWDGYLAAARVLP